LQKLQAKGAEGPRPLSLHKGTRNLTGKTSALSHHLECLQIPQRSFRDLAENVDKMQPDTLGPERTAGPGDRESERRYIFSSDVLHLSFSLC